MGFFAVTMVLFLLVRHQPPITQMKMGTKGEMGFPYWQRLVFSVIICAVCIAVAASRVYLSYHTPTQVVVGGVAGALCGLAWYAVTAWLRRHGWLDWGLDTRLAKLGRWRDLVVEEDLAEGGWKRWIEVKDMKKGREMNGAMEGRKER